MNVPIKTKLITMCILLVLVITLSISTTYYVLTRQEKQRESEQRIQIAFDIILSDFNSRTHTSLTRFNDFLQEDTRLLWATGFYHSDESSLSTVSVIVGYFVKAVEELKKFGHIASVDRLLLYSGDTRLLMLYQRNDGQETSGLYVKTETGKDTFLTADNVNELNQILMGGDAIPEIDLPTNVAARYAHDIPDTISAGIFHDGQTLGIQVVAPVYHKEVKIGVLVGNMLYTQAIIDRYAALSKTDVNFFAGHQFSLGTLPEQTSLDRAFVTQLMGCDRISEGQNIGIAPITINRHDYYQGGCSLSFGGEALGAITVSLSQAVEQQAIHKMLTSVFVISLSALGLAFGLSILFSRKAVHTIEHLVNVIGAAAEGDLRRTASITSRDEFGLLAGRLNQMITQLRTISEQVQQVSQTVHGSADGIQQQMAALTDNMQQQLSSVDDTTELFEEVRQFIDIVSHNTSELLASAEQILATIQETRASTEEVTTSTKHLTVELQRIVGSVDQVDLSMKSI
ncbi:MAG: methyl-accepting chemotaxis protein, partial [bacterium]|nr:methyl-accepting chemotaxis protein [bacterium]